MNNVGQNGNEVGDAVAAEGAANILTVFRVVKSLGFFSSWSTLKAPPTRHQVIKPSRHRQTKPYVAYRDIRLFPSKSIR